MKTTAQTCQRAAGFTVIELLVVVGSVAVLAAFLIPALAASRPRTQQMVCMNNLKQLTLAEIMYCEEDAHSLPYLAPDGITGGWFVNLRNYFIGATNLMICPTTSQPAVAEDNWVGDAVTPWCRTDYLGNNAPYFGSFAINGWFYTSGPNPLQGAGDGTIETLPGGSSGNPAGYYLTGNQVKYPSHTPVFADGVWVDCWPLETDAPCHNTRGAAAFNSPNRGTDLSGQEMARVCLARHNCDPFAENTWTTPNQRQVIGAVNVGLFDGHAELSSLPHLWSYYWHNNWNPGKVGFPC